MTSTTATRYTVQTRTITLPRPWSPATRLRRFARTMGFVVGGAASIATDVDGVLAPMARRTVGSQRSDRY